VSGNWAWVPRNIGQMPQLWLSVIKWNSLLAPLFPLPSPLFSALLLPTDFCFILFLMMIASSSIFSLVIVYVLLFFSFFFGLATHLFHLGFYALCCQFAGAFQFRVDCLGIYDADNWSSGNADADATIVDGPTVGQFNSWTVGPGFVTIRLIVKGVGWSNRAQTFV